MPDPHDWFLESDETGRLRLDAGPVRLQRHVGHGRQHRVAAASTTDTGTTFEPHIAVGLRERHHRRLQPGHVLPRATPVTRAQMALFIDRAMHLPPTERGLLRRRRRRDRRGEHQPPGRGRHHRRLRRPAVLPEPDGDPRPDGGLPRAGARPSAAGRARPLQWTTTARPIEADIDSLFEAGITTGCGPDLYCPTASVTRGQMAAFLYRAFADYHRRD